jgi:hypothetical protein
MLEAAPPAARLARYRAAVFPTATALEVAESAWIAEGVSREMALSIPAVVAAHKWIVGTVIQLGVKRSRGGELLEPDYLLSKPDPSTTWPATIGGTVDDLLFDARAYGRVLDRDSEGYPKRARWIPQVDVSADTRSTGGRYAELLGYRIAGERERVAVDDVIRFDSPLPGLLDAGGRTLAAAIELEQAARRLAAVELPAGVLTNTGAELSQADLDEAVRHFAEQRRELGIAGLQGWTYDRADVNANDLQLVEARANVATDVGRLTNVPAPMISASPSGGASALLYSNLSQQLAVLISGAVSPHLIVLEATLSDALPRGQSVAFDVQAFLRSDPTAAAEYAINLKTANIVTTDESRGFLGIAPAGDATPDVTPGKV